MLFDTHCHINTDKFKDDLEKTINSATKNGVKKMLVVGFDHKTNEDAILLAEKYDFIYATVGFHPSDAKKISDKDFTILEKQLQHPKVVAVGECGMDMYWDKTFVGEQINVFQRQIELSLKYSKPLIIHMRDASEVTYNVLSEYNGLSGVMHCYTGSVEMAKMFIKLGLYISIGGIVTFKNARVSKEVAEFLNLDKMLIETDSPYLAPHPHRGKRNEPSYVKLVAEEVSRIKGIPYIDVAKTTYINALKLFNIKE